jgi:hypothetical protein
MISWKCGFTGNQICHLDNASTSIEKNMINIQDHHDSCEYKLTEKDDYDRIRYEENRFDIRNFKLNQLANYHVLDNYAFDLTHDLWEGIVDLNSNLF